MDMIHVGLVASSEDGAERFFGGLLGLPRVRRSELPVEVGAGLFGLEESCPILYFGDGAVVFEVFVTGWTESSPRRMSHTCLAVDDRSELVERSRTMGFELREVPKGDKVIVFIADADGNLFEIVERG